MMLASLLQQVLQIQQLLLSRDCTYGREEQQQQQQQQQQQHHVDHILTCLVFSTITTTPSYVVQGSSACVCVCTMMALVIMLAIMLMVEMMIIVMMKVEDDFNYNIVMMKVEDDCNHNHDEFVSATNVFLRSAMMFCVLGSIHSISSANIKRLGQVLTPNNYRQNPFNALNS